MATLSSTRHNPVIRAPPPGEIKPEYANRALCLLTRKLQGPTNILGAREAVSKDGERPWFALADFEVTGEGSAVRVLKSNLGMVTLLCTLGCRAVRQTRDSRTVVNQIGSSDGSPKDIDEEVLSALVAGHRTRALLLLHRARGGDLAANWRIISDLDDRKSFDRPGQDPAYARVERYLSGSGLLKDKLAFVIPVVAVLSVGLALMATAWPRFSTGIRSYSWPTAQAEVVNARQFQRRRLVNTREQTEHLMDYHFRYSVDSAQFTKVIKSRAYYPALGEKPVAIGDVIEVLYDPDNPGTCLHGRDMYQRSLLFVLGAVIALVACGPLALVGWFEYDRRALAKHDPMSMTA